MTTATIRRDYRASLILDLRGTTDAPETVIDKLKDVLKSVDCKVNEVENLGQKEFSRVVDRKFPAGLYVQFHFEGPVTAPTEMSMKRSPAVVMVVRSKGQRASQRLPARLIISAVKAAKRTRKKAVRRATPLSLTSNRIC